MVFNSTSNLKQIKNKQIAKKTKYIEDKNLIFTSQVWKINKNTIVLEHSTFQLVFSCINSAFWVAVEEIIATHVLPTIYN